MISLDEAQARIIALATLLPAETVPIENALGRWTAEAIVAKRDQPARDVSAMDGYAVAGNSTGPWRVVGESAAGESFGGAVGAGEAVRIFTGAALPAGTDAIIIQEDAQREGEFVSADAVPVGKHVRVAGSDFRREGLLIEAGLPLTPARIALAATAGHGALTVRRAPKVAYLATGNELVRPGEIMNADQLSESNGLMVAAMLSQIGIEMRHCGIVRDDLDAIVAAIRSVDADLLITSGGASVGDHDLVRPALERCGAAMDFMKVAMRPGKPVMAGRIGAMAVIGIPGNPVSAFATTLLFVMPCLKAMAGAQNPLPTLEKVRLAAELPPNGARVDHIRARMTKDRAMPIGANDSAALLSLSRSDCLIRRVIEAPAATLGDTVEIIRIA